MKFSRQLLLVAAAVIMSVIMREAIEQRKHEADWTPLIPVAPARVVDPPAFRIMDKVGPDTASHPNPVFITQNDPRLATAQLPMPPPERILLLKVDDRFKMIAEERWRYVVSGIDAEGKRWSCSVSKEIYEAMPERARLVIRASLCTSVSP